MAICQVPDKTNKSFRGVTIFKAAATYFFLLSFLCFRRLKAKLNCRARYIPSRTPFALTSFEYRIKHAKRVATKPFVHLQRTDLRMAACMMPGFHRDGKINICCAVVNGAKRFWCDDSNDDGDGTSTDLYCVQLFYSLIYLFILYDTNYYFIFCI